MTFLTSIFLGPAAASAILAPAAAALAVVAPVAAAPAVAAPAAAAPAVAGRAAASAVSGPAAAAPAVAGISPSLSLPVAISFTENFVTSHSNKYWIMMFLTFLFLGPAAATAVTVPAAASAVVVPAPAAAFADWRDVDDRPVLAKGKRSSPSSEPSSTTTITGLTIRELIAFAAWHSVGRYNPDVPLAKGVDSCFCLKSIGLPKGSLSRQCFQAARSTSGILQAAASAMPGMAPQIA
ncbi:hypothetical protein BDD12DRAFT_884214 [Trichophaea hybrida]|nr:hypothetical protein BDD12DRAFT_884214 [Trichophaea hybrida]